MINRLNLGFYSNINMISVYEQPKCAVKHTRMNPPCTLSKYA